MIGGGVRSSAHAGDEAYDASIWTTSRGRRGWGMRVWRVVTAAVIGAALWLTAVGCGPGTNTPIVTFRGPEEQRDVLTLTTSTTSRDRVVTTEYWVLRWSMAGIVEERRWPRGESDLIGPSPWSAAGACYRDAKVGKPLPDSCR